MSEDPHSSHRRGIATAVAPQGGRRVGHEGGPQVTDPRAPEWAAHEAWRDQVWESQQQRGLGVSTLTPEWGPPPSQPSLPYTGLPTSDLVGTCDQMPGRQRTRFAAR